MAPSYVWIFSVRVLASGRKEPDHVLLYPGQPWVRPLPGPQQEWLRRSLENERTLQHEGFRVDLRKDFWRAGRCLQGQLGKGVKGVGGQGAVGATGTSVPVWASGIALSTQVQPAAPGPMASVGAFGGLLCLQAAAGLGPGTGPHAWGLPHWKVERLWLVGQGRLSPSDHRSCDGREGGSKGCSIGTRGFGGLGTLVLLLYPSVTLRGVLSNSEIRCTRRDRPRAALFRLPEDTELLDEIKPHFSMCRTTHVL